MNTSTDVSITIRPAYPDDAAALRRLAALDSADVPAAPLLVAEVAGQLRVAVSMADLTAIADPFVLTAHLVDLMQQHIKKSHDGSRPRRRRLFVKPRLAPGLQPV